MMVFVRSPSPCPYPFSFLACLPRTNVGCIQTSAATMGDKAKGGLRQFEGVQVRVPVPQHFEPESDPGDGGRISFCKLCMNRISYLSKYVFPNAVFPRGVVPREVVSNDYDYGLLNQL